MTYREALPALDQKNLKEILDTRQLTHLLDRLQALVKAPLALLDAKGAILYISSWTPFCRDAVRSNAELARACDALCASVPTSSGTLSEQFQCPHGLTMLKAYIRNKQEIVAQLVVSQFFHKAPDEEKYRDLARDLGIDPDPFMEGLHTVPVLDIPTREATIGFMEAFVLMLHELIEKRLRAKSLEEELNRSYEELEASYQDLSEMNDRLSLLNQEALLQTDAIRRREVRISTLLQTLQQGIMLLRTHPERPDGLPEILEINQYASQLLAESACHAPENGDAASERLAAPILAWISQRLTGGNEGKPVYQAPNERTYAFNHAVICENEHLVCLQDITDVTSRFEIQRRQMWELVVAMSGLVEKRDQFTASHQKKVAILASKIAQELGLPHEEQERVFIASLLHDIGKISLPAEILTKPGKLSDVEYMLMKTHVQHANDILKDLSFLSPVTAIVLQHHERLDGSGYPQGTRESDIGREARILAVADVYEAMTSHRPYRPSLGSEAARNHLLSGSGTLYDPGIVEACLAVAENRTLTLGGIMQRLNLRPDTPAAAGSPHRHQEYGLSNSRTGSGTASQTP